MAMGIDKGMLKGFLLILGIVSAVGAIFMASYIWAIVGGAVSYAATNGTTTTQTAVTEESFTGLNETGTLLANNPVISGTLSIYNSSNNVVFGLTNFTIDYTKGNVTIIGSNEIVTNNTALVANYTYSTTTGTSMPITDDAMTFLETGETSFFTNLTTIQTAAGFAAALITVAVILLVFAGFIKPAKDAYGSLKGGNKGKGNSGLSY